MTEGYFTANSVTWRIHSDTAMFVGGIRALLEQALHPKAMAGVAAHSNFREDAWVGCNAQVIMLEPLPLAANLKQISWRREFAKCTRC